jgi:hypothetical protein
MKENINMAFFTSKKWLGIPLLLISLAACADSTSKQHKPHVQEHSNSPLITVYKSASCACCSRWVKHLEAEGFEVKAENRSDMAAIKSDLGVPTPLRSCHTAKVGDYVLEGHILASDIRRLLAERPVVQGLTVPGMPLGSPGMEHPRPQHYSTLAFQENGESSVFAQHSPEDGQATSQPELPN